MTFSLNRQISSLSLSMRCFLSMYMCVCGLARVLPLAHIIRFGWLFWGGARHFYRGQFYLMLHMSYLLGVMDFTMFTWSSFALKRTGRTPSSRWWMNWMSVPMRKYSTNDLNWRREKRGANHEDVYMCVWLQWIGTEDGKTSCTHWSKP